MGLIVHLIDVSSERSTIIPLLIFVFIDGQKLCRMHPVLIILALEPAAFTPRRRRISKLFKGEIVDIRAERGLQGQLFQGAIPEDCRPFIVVFLRLVRHLMEHPIGIDVVNIAVVPIVILPFGVLIVMFEPRLVKGRGERHQVLCHIGTVIGHRRTVRYTLSSVSNFEV